MENLEQVEILNIIDGIAKIPIFKQYIEEIRKIRDKKLTETDYMVLPDVASKRTDIENIAILDYRQRLRDLMNDILNDKVFININEPPEELVCKVVKLEST